MPLPLEELREKHIAMPGEEMLCPGCGEALLLFTGHSFRGAKYYPAADVRPSGERYTLYCRLCGEGSTRAGGAVHGMMIEDAQWSCMLIRSGSWTGWRALGGE